MFLLIFHLLTQHIHNYEIIFSLFHSDADIAEILPKWLKSLFNQSVNQTTSLTVVERSTREYFAHMKASLHVLLYHRKYNY